jgi:aryl-alcohol dehydrogenase-like predicted oxidoreductase
VATDGRLDHLLRNADGTPAQVALAWLLARSEVVLPIPGTSQVSHLEENVRAAQITLTDDQVAELTAAGAPHRSRHPV